MNDFARWLAEGDLTFDTRADEVVGIVMDAPSQTDDLMACLKSSNSVVRSQQSMPSKRSAGKNLKYSFLTFTSCRRPLSKTQSVWSNFIL